MDVHPDKTSSGDEYYNLGTYHRAVSTRNQCAQKWFDRGLVWSYAFNHEESVTCFEEAAAIDPDCVMAYWGIAYALGPNYNKPWAVFDDRELEENVGKALRSIKQAQKKASQPGFRATAVEVALVNALQHRCPQTLGGFTPDEAFACGQKYAQAMRSVYQDFADDLDVATLYADALMNLAPWQLWDLKTGEPAEGAAALEVKQILERAIARGHGATHHPGLLHLYIHLMEMSDRPELALTAADCLRELVPDAGHLSHMPTHLDILCGDYRRAIASNSQAIAADEKFVNRRGARNFYALYRCHNYHFRIYAAMFAGQSKVALETTSALEAALPDDLLRLESPPMADWLEGFLAMRVHVLIRFGLWHDIIDLQLPGDREFYCTTTAMTLYAKGVALAATGRIHEAEEHRSLFRAAVKLVSPSRTLFNNTCCDILTVAASMLDGEIEYRRGNPSVAFEYLRKAIALEDSLPYDEPWGWMQPTRHAYGALLLEQGQVADAAAVYSADLGLSKMLPRARQHRNNVWALHGYHECLTMLGRKQEARIIETQLQLATAVADIRISSSCYCRKGVVGN
ncbi:hypothetical protein QBC46DRAFT_398722 [Diplogelasinospora grovesii]|uniref:TPR domain protein n=1 Tax=Diplogelasinospora grovesii TaxID=303347 RepID=A0AAN6MZ64_9PEZI|nr:hypothetical protein QBC46DRAFT_398722 [Diplogelasinospora grovesii]